MRSGRAEKTQWLAIIGAGLLLMAGPAARAGDAPAKPGAATQAEAVLPRTQQWFGVAVENIPGPIARQLKLRKDQGLMVLSVLPGTPAEKAGLKADDLLIEVNGKALTSQEELAHAANRMDVTAKGEVRPQMATIVYLREGDRATAEIMPEPRPTTMVVLGANLGNFQPSLKEDASGSPQSRVRNLVLPNGVSAQVGPGYRIDPSSKDASMLSIQSLVSKGQTAVLTQDTDASGKTKSTITVGATTYDVDKDKLGNLPEELRPVAEQLLWVPVNGGAAQRGVNGQLGTIVLQPVTTQSSQMEERVKVLEERNLDLEKKLDTMLKLLQEQQQKGLEKAGEKGKTETPGK